MTTPTRRRTSRTRPGSGFDRVRKDFLTYIRVECGLAPNTIEAYERDLRQLIIDLEYRGVRSVREISPRRLTEHIASLKSERRMASSSVARHLATIKVFCRWLHARGHIEHNPSDILDQPTRWKRLPNVLSPRQVRALLSAAGPNPHRPDDSPLWQRADFRLPGAAFAERDGSLVNHADRLQSFRWAVRPPVGAKVEGHVVWELLKRPGMYDARAVLSEVAAEIAFFAAAADEVGASGVDLKVRQMV